MGEAAPQSLTCPSDGASWWRQLGAARAVARVGGPQVSGGAVFRREGTQVKLGLPGDSLSRGISAPRTHDMHTAPSCRPRSGARTCGVRQGQHQLWQWGRATRGRGVGQGLYGAHTSTLVVVLDV